MSFAIKERFTRQCGKYSWGELSLVFWKTTENLVFSLWVEVSYLTSVYVDVEGWVSTIRKLRTAVRAHIQVAWWWEGACLYLFLTIVCRVFACPSVLAGQIWWRSRHMDQTFCLTKNACFEVHLIVVDLDTTDQPRRAGPILSVNSPDFCFKKNPHKVCWEDSRIM